MGIQFSFSGLKIYFTNLALFFKKKNDFISKQFEESLSFGVVKLQQSLCSHLILNLIHQKDTL